MNRTRLRRVVDVGDIIVSLALGGTIVVVSIGYLDMYWELLTAQPTSAGIRMVGRPLLLPFVVTVGIALAGVKVLLAGARRWLNLPSIRQPSTGGAGDPRQEP